MADLDIDLENAIRYISDELKLNPGAKRSDLIDAASRKFDLTPMQSEMLVNKYVLSGK